ncbi:MAG: RHS repeat-associated core domain-containing protein [Minicystis sp.]
MHVESEDGASPRAAYTDYHYEKREHAGIPFAETRQVLTGIVDGARGAIELSRTTYTQCAERHEGTSDACDADRQDPPRCALGEVRTVGPVTRQTLRTRFVSAASPWDGALSCLVNEERVFELYGGGQRQLLAASKVTRNPWGAVIEEAVASAAADHPPYRTTKTTRYNDDATIASSTVEGKGTVTFTYDVADRPLWKTRTNAAGVVTRVVRRHPIAEAPEQMEVLRGPSTLRFNASFDTSGRLLARWSSLHGTADHPLVELAYWDAGAGVTYGARRLTVAHGARSGTLAILHPDPQTTEMRLVSTDRDTTMTAKAVGGVWSEVGVETRELLDAGNTVTRYAHVSAIPVSIVPSPEDVAPGSVELARNFVSPLGHVEERWAAPPEGGPMVLTLARRIVSVDPVDRLLTEEITMANGQVRTERTDADGNVYRVCLAGTEVCVDTHRDALGRPAEMQLADGTRARILWNPDGQVGDIVWSTGLQAVFRRDTYGRLEEAAVYDPQLAIVSRSRLTYDAIGRVLMEENIDAGAVAPVVKKYGYGIRDQVGFLTYVGLSGGLSGFKWDGLGRLVGEGTRGLGPLTDLSRSYELRGDGSLAAEHAKLTVAQGSTQTKRNLDLRFDYRDDGVPLGLRVDGGLRVAFRYDTPDPLMPTVEIERGGVVGERCHVRRKPPFSPNEWQCVGSAGGDWGYSAGRDVAWTRSERLASASATFERDRGRLARTVRDDGSVEVYTHDLDRTLRAAHDGAGNALIGPQLGWGPNRQVGGLSFDASGRLSARGTARYSYDGQGRLVKVTGQGSESSIARDFDGKPFAEVVSGKRGAVWKGDVCADADDTLWKTIGVAGVPLVAVSSKGTVEALRTDARGTTHIASAQRPEPYGPRERSGLPGHCFATFAGMRTTSVDGLYLAGARDYAADLGRFLEPDPLVLFAPGRCSGDPFTCAAYGYADGDPASRRDPGGLKATSKDDEEKNAGTSIGLPDQQMCIPGTCVPPPRTDFKRMLKELNMELALRGLAGDAAAAETVGGGNYGGAPTHSIDGTLAQIDRFLAALGNPGVRKPSLDSFYKRASSNFEQTNGAFFGDYKKYALSIAGLLVGGMVSRAGFVSPQQALKLLITPQALGGLSRGLATLGTFGTFGSAVIGGGLRAVGAFVLFEASVVLGSGIEAVGFEAVDWAESASDFIEDDPY